MPYMIYQQYTTAIKEAYANHDDLEAQIEAAKAYREWLEALEIDRKLSAPLVEPIAAIERALIDLQRARS